MPFCIEKAEGKGVIMFWNIFKSRITDEQIKKIINPLLAEMEKRVNFLQSMQKLDVKDGDIIVLRHPQRLSAIAHDNLKVSIEKSIKHFGLNIRVLVLEENMDIGVLRKNNVREGGEVSL